MESIVKNFQISAEAAAALFAWRDNLIQEKATELQAVRAELEALKVTHSNYVANAQTALNATASVVEDPTMEPAAQVAKITDIVEDLQQPDKARQLVEINAQMAALEERRKALVQ